MVVADGGSTDETLALLHGRPEVDWRADSDHRLSDAVHDAGATRALTEVFGWLSAEDASLPGALAQAYQGL